MLKGKWDWWVRRTETSRGGGPAFESGCPEAGREGWIVIAEYGKIISKLCFCAGSCTNIIDWSFALL
jgi:hypothetical protein